MRIALAGAGAFGEKHLDGLQKIEGVEIVSIISRTGEQAAVWRKAQLNGIERHARERRC